MKFLILLVLQASIIFADFTLDLMNTSREIRGERWACVGNISDENFKNFKSFIDKSLDKPDSFSPTQTAQILEESRKYFKFWAYKSISNFGLYTDFWEKYAIFVKDLTKYYEENFSFSHKKSLNLAQNIANEFLKYAVGSFGKFRKLTPFEDFVSGKNFDKSALNWAFYEYKPNKLELTNALNIALLNGANFDVINQFLDYGVNLNSGDENSIFFALKNLDNLEILIKNGANINHKNSFGKTAIFYAVEFGDVKIIDFLIKNGANINKSYINSSEKQAYASNLGLLPFYQNLCDLEHTSRTLFMHASYHSNPEILSLLIKNGADINAVDDLGYDALDYANLGKNLENVKLLKSILKPKE